MEVFAAELIVGFVIILPRTPYFRAKNPCTERIGGCVGSKKSLSGEYRCHCTN
jgi:hypothetical protein